MAELSGFDRGLLVGVLIGEGHFGGDGKQPQVTLRMHVRHEALFRWLVERPAAGRLAVLLELLEDPATPTTVHRPAEAADAHLADSLVALELDAVRSARAIADLGSGVVFPGLALAVALPGARLALV